MALSTAQILQLITDNIPDNTSNFITPELTREVLEEMAGSYANLISSVSNLGLSEWSNTKTYPLGQCVVLDNVIYQSVVANTTIGTFTPSDWVDITAGTDGGLGGDFVAKTNAIELKDNKLLQHLPEDEFLRSLDTGFYTTTTPTLFGLNEEYPTNKRGMVQSYKSEAGGIYGNQFYYTYDGEVYLRDANVGIWSKISKDEAITYTFDEGLTENAGSVNLGGDFTNVNLNGGVGSLFELISENATITSTLLTIISELDLTGKIAMDGNGQLFILTNGGSNINIQPTRIDITADDLYIESNLRMGSNFVVVTEDIWVNGKGKYNQSPFDVTYSDAVENDIPNVGYVDFKITDTLNDLGIDATSGYATQTYVDLGDSALQFQIDAITHNPDYTTAGLASTVYVDNADVILQNQIDSLDIKDYTTAGLATIVYSDASDLVLQNQIDSLESATTGINDSLDIITTKLDTIETGAEVNQTDSEIKTQYENNANTNEFSDSEKSKLASLDSSKFLGEYVTLTALQSAHPSPVVGSYANVDSGVGSDVERWIWDDSDGIYVQQLGTSTFLTDAQIKTQYENNANTNAFTDSEQTLLGNQSGTNTGDETTSSIQTKRPLKTVNGNTLEGNGNIVISSGTTNDYTTAGLVNDTQFENGIYFDTDDNKVKLGEQLSEDTEIRLNGQEFKITDGSAYIRVGNQGIYSSQGYTLQNGSKLNWTTSSPTDASYTATTYIDSNNSQMQFTVPNGNMYLTNNGITVINGNSDNLIFDTSQFLIQSGSATMRFNYADDCLYVNKLNGVEITDAGSSNLFLNESGTYTSATKPTLSKTLTLDAPTSSDNITIFRTDVAITVQEVIAVSTGTSPSTSYSIRHEPSRSSSPGEGVTNLSQVTTSVTTGDTATLDDPTIPANSWIWLITDAASGTDVTLTVDIRYTED